MLMLAQSTLPAFSQSTAPVVPNANAPAGQRPIMDAASNGVPIVHIAPPSAAGVSRNEYTQFNVNPNGLILNNSTVNTQTQLGGWVTSNLQLGPVPARIILNEVVSTNPSQLRGTMEVAGQRADIVLANPNGITCDGCGFLNTGRASLSTGRAQFGGDGSIQSFDVRQGQLTVGSNGLSATNAEQLDLIARGLVIEGEIWAKNLNAITGANRVLYGSLQASAQSGTGAVPGFAIDIKNLGGMYANQIYLVATEKGLGVNSAGRTAALQGNLVLSVNGDLSLRDSYAKKNVHIDSSGNIQLSGQTQAEGAGAINASGDLSNQGTVDVQSQLVIKAAAIRNIGTVAQRNADGASLKTAGAINNSGAIYSGGTLVATGRSLKNDAGKITAALDLQLTNQGLSNDQGLLQSGRDASINTQGQVLVNTNSGTTGGILAGGTLNLAAGSLDNRAGFIASNGSQVLSVTADIDNGQEGKILGNSDSTITATRILNSAGLISSLGKAKLTADTLENRSGQLSAGNDSQLQLAMFDNTSGVLTSTKNLDLAANSLVNDSGKLIGDESVTIQTSSQAPGGTIASANNVTLTVNGDYSNAGLLSAQKNLTVNASNIHNSGTLTAGQALTANTGNLANSGEISANNLLLNLTGTLSNAGAGLIDGGDTRIDAATTNNTGRIYGDRLRIAGGTLNNSRNGAIAARDTLLISVQNLNNTEGGLIYSSGDIEMAGSFDSAGQPQGAMQNLINASSTIEAGRNLSISAVSIVNRNDHLTTRTVVDGSWSEDKIEPRSSGTRYSIEHCWGIGGGQDNNSCIVHPDRYGQRSTILPARSESCDIDGNCAMVPNYSWDSPVFAQFQIAPVGPPPAQPPSCGIFVLGAACSQWQSELVAWDAQYQNTLNQLTPRIDAYNAQVNEDNRTVNFEDYTWYRVIRTDSHTQVASSAPGQILAGAKIMLTGAGIGSTVINSDSHIVAGGVLEVNGSSVSNQATKGEIRSDYNATREDTEVVSCGTFGNKHCRKWYGQSPYPIQAKVDKSQDLPTIRYDQYAGNATSGRVLTGAAASADNSTAPVIMPSAGSSRDLPLLGPTSRLFALHAEPAALYLVETDPRFTNYRTFLSSDYFLNALNRDPSHQIKRYGDGFAEQQLVNDQILALTGRRYLSGYASTEDEYKALMNAGVAFARQYRLTPGVALTAEQIALLSTDIVWLVTRTVALPDGSNQDVLVPQVYLRRPTSIDLMPNGALIAANNVRITTAGDLVNKGTIAGDSVTIEADNDLVNQQGHIGGHDIWMHASNDLKNLSGVIGGTGANSLVNLLAGRDMLLQTQTVQTASKDGNSTRTNVQRVATIQGGDVQLEAGRDLAIAGAIVNAKQNLIATASEIKVTAVAGGQRIEAQGISGRSIREDADKTEGGQVPASRTAYSREEQIANQLATLNSGNNVVLAATGNVGIQGANIAAGQAGSGEVQIQGQSVIIESTKDRSATDTQFIGAKSYTRGARDDETLVGGSITAADNVAIRATGAPAIRVYNNDGSHAGDDNGGPAVGNVGGDIALTGVAIAAQKGQVALTANNDIVVQNGTARHLTIDESYSKSGNMLRTTATTRSDYVDAMQVQGSSVSGNTFVAQAIHDLTVQGSSVAGDGDVTLAAGNNASIIAAIGTRTESHYTKVKEDGFLSGGGFGITYGERITTTDQNQRATTQSGQSRSLVGSNGGNLNVQSGAAVKVSGSDIVAAQDVDITGKSVTIDPGRDTTDGKLTYRMQQDGLTLAVGGTVVNAIQTMQAMDDAAGNTGNSRVKALAAATAAMAAANAAKDVATNGVSVSISLTVGHSETEQTRTHSASNAVGSTVVAGNDLNIRATGDGKASNIHVIGSDLSANNNVNLVAEHEVNFLAAQDLESQHSKSKSMSAAAGVAISASTNGGIALGVTGSVGMGRSQEDGEGVTQRNTHVTAGNQLAIRSGGATNIKGGVVSGKEVHADIGGDLNIESQQDTAQFDSMSQSASVSATVGYGASVSASYSQSKIRNDYASVQEQSGIQAGDGGFDIVVKGNTDLKGGIVSSSQTAIENNKNRLTTGTLTVSDIQNYSNASADTVGISASASISGGNDKEGGREKGPGKTNLINAGSGPNVTDGKYEAGKTILGNLLNNGAESGSSSGITRSAIGTGTITITNAAEQWNASERDAADVIASIRRETAGTNETVKKLNVQQMATDAQIRQAFNQAVFQEAAKFTDESYRKMFLEKAKVYEILKDGNGKPLLNDDGTPLMRELSNAEKRNLKAGSDGVVHIANNGIFNDGDAASKYANQHSSVQGAQYLIHFPEADNMISELLIAGYQKFLENDLLGLANATAETKRMMLEYGQTGLHIDGHSRGALTTGNALESLNRQPDAQGILSGTTINFYGPAYNAEKADAILSNLQNREAVSVLAQKNGMVLQMQNHQADPVGRLFFIGNNPSTGGTIPEGSNVAKEAINALGGEFTVHNCYGNGDARCQKFWQTYPDSVPQLKPVKNYP